MNTQQAAFLHTIQIIAEEAEQYEETKPLASVLHDVPAALLIDDTKTLMDFTAAYCEATMEVIKIMPHMQHEPPMIYQCKHCHNTQFTNVICEHCSCSNFEPGII